MKKEFQNKKSKVKQEPPKPIIKKEIPLFDPNTGEPNPLYEELTGKPNPLLDKWKKEDFFNTPQNFEPKLKNRFLVLFPEVINIKPYMVTEVKLPSMEVKKGIFGSKYFMSTQLELTMIDSTDNPRLPVLFSWFKDYTKLDLTIEQLDPRNVIIQKFTFKNCLITTVDCDSMGYSKDDTDLYSYKLKISVDSFNIE